MLALKCLSGFLKRRSEQLADINNRLIDEKNDRLKTLIRGKITEYLDRAEKLKEHISKTEEKKARRAVGANGASAGGPGGTGAKYVLQHK